MIEAAEARGDEALWVACDRVVGLAATALTNSPSRRIRMPTKGLGGPMVETTNLTRIESGM
jgi:hypothetical protein